MYSDTKVHTESEYIDLTCNLFTSIVIIFFLIMRIDLYISMHNVSIYVHI